MKILQGSETRIMSSNNGFQPAAVQLCYENINGSCIQTPYSLGPQIILYMAFGSGAVLAVFGNFLVMISIFHFKQLHSPANFLIASLAYADFLVGATVMPFSMVRSVESCWYFGKRYCKVHCYFDGSFCYSSIFHLCFISIDRYIAVTDPLIYPTKVTLNVSLVCITVSWLLAITYVFSILSTGVNDDGLEELVSALKCVGGCQTAMNQTWSLVGFLLFFIPTLVMVILYFKIFLIAKQQARRIENTSSKGESSSSDSYKARVSKRERKAAKTLGIAVIAFVISWFPYFVETIIDAFLGFITPTYIYEILVWFAYYNSAMNPLIYAFFYPWFRRAVKLIVTGKVFRGHTSTIDLFSEQAKASNGRS
ncbi:trace amine-associated receptor 8b-like [Dromiciops gliroides]|uniref:trace amine-associated receptor 8b-like n=1 Tax=Dromiciops gliroides TaxID=33562 RepID=UPI001CC42894|nr:trace amine-associated receptor 8b-like [Dromiciops gliroides]